MTMHVRLLRTATRCAAPALLAVLVALASLGCSDVPLDSGIEGEVRIGPINPVEQPGVDNTAPYAATLVIKSLPDGDEIARVESGEDGLFSVALGPGDYLLEPVNGDPLPVAEQQTVTVEAGVFTKVTVSFDSGIR